MAFMIDNKAGYMSDIVLFCNKFKAIRRAVRQTDTDWADVTGYKDGTRTSVELGVGGHWERLSIKGFERA